MTWQADLAGATISLDEWFSRIQHGYKGAPYAYKNTRTYQGLKGAWAEAHGTPAPVPTPTPVPSQSLARAVQNVVFCAQRSEAALLAPAKFKVALTADPAYAGWATPGVVAQFRAQGRKVYAWGVQTQIPPSEIRALNDRLNLDGCIFQGETPDEYRTAIEAGARMLVGNPNAWTDEQRRDAIDRVTRGTLAVIGECYTNLGGPWPKDYSAAGVPVASVCLGVYDGSHETAGGWNPSLTAYKANTPAGVWASCGVYHAAGVDPSEWGLLA